MKIQRWPMLVVGLLVTHVGLMSWAVVICTSDMNSAVIPNYYEKAVRFDQTKAARLSATTTTAGAAR